MEMVTTAEDAAIVVLQLSLRRTLSDTTALNIQRWHDTLALAKLIRDRSLTWLVLYHVDLCQVILLINALVATSKIMVLLFLIRIALT